MMSRIRSTFRASSTPRSQTSTKTHQTKKYIVNFKGVNKLATVLHKEDLKKTCAEAFGVSESMVALEAFLDDFGEFAEVPLEDIPDKGRLRLRMEVGTSICSASTEPVHSVLDSRLDSSMSSLLTTSQADVVEEDVGDEENNRGSQGDGEGARGVRMSTPPARLALDPGTGPVHEGAKEQVSTPQMEQGESTVVFDPDALPQPLRDNMKDPNYEPTDDDIKKIITCLHTFYTARSYYPQANGYQFMVEALFKIFPQLAGKESSGEQIVLKKMSFRKRLRTKFKNGRRATDSEKLKEEQERMGIQSRSNEGMSNFLPEFKKPRIELNVMSAQLSSVLGKAESEEQAKNILKENFALRRQLVAAPKSRLSIDQLKSLYPQWCTEKAVWWDIESIAGGDMTPQYEEKMNKLSASICTLTDCEMGDSARNLCLLSGECSSDILNSPAPRAQDVYVTKNHIYVGDTMLMKMSEDDELKQLLLLAAIHAVFYLRFHGVGRHTLTLIYAKVLGFNVPLTVMGNAVWKKLENQ